MRWMLPLAVVAALRAATAADIVAAADASLTQSQRDEPGSGARAAALVAALEGAGDLPATDRVVVRLALAEAWLDANRPERCVEVATATLALPALAPELRERAALAWIAAGRAYARRGDAAIATTTLDALAKAGETTPRASAHALIARAELALVLGPDRKPLDAAAGLAALDKALELLASAPAAERVPVYTLRVTAMERNATKPKEILAWLEGHKGDPAAAEVAESAIADSDRMVGAPAPALAGPRGDGAAQGQIDLLLYRGKPVLVDFFATWCQPCLQVAPAIVDLAKRHPEMQVLGVSLDNTATIGELPAYLAKHGATWPVIADGLGWDSELDDAWRVTAIPNLILVGPDGRIAAGDLVGADAEETTKRVEAALAALQAPPPAPKPPEATDVIP